MQPSDALVSVGLPVRNGADRIGDVVRSVLAQDHPRIELLRFTDMTVWQEWSPAAWMGTAKAADRITKVWRDAASLTDWLDEHVGPSTEPGR